MSPTGLRALTQNQAAEIIGLYHSRQYTQRELARRFGVSQGTISNIVSYRLYVTERNAAQEVNSLVQNAGRQNNTTSPFD